MIVFGLGNPGPKYVKSRHNVGFMTIEKLAAQEGMSLRKRCLHSYKWARFPSLVKEGDNVFVIVDNMDLPVGRIRIRRGGGDAGHNGLKSIISNIGKDFTRVYIGIGRPREGVSVVDHVLSDFSDEEFSDLEKAMDRAVEALMSLNRGEDLLSVIQRANTF